MSERQNKVFLHPEKEEIISKMLNGASVKEVEAWLKEKHPKKRKLWISYATLQKFRKDYLHLEGEVLDNIKAARKEKDLESNELERRAILASSNAYQEKINQIASYELDINKRLVEVITLVSSRIEYHFNSIEIKGKNTFQEDKAFIDYVTLLRNLFQDYKKYVEGFADQKIDHNVNITVVNEQINVLKSIVFEVIQDLDPELVSVFIDKVNAKLSDTQHGSKIYEAYSNNSPYRQLDVIDAIK